MNTDPDVKEILAAFTELRRVAGDGPAMRKLLDALFRSVHNLKANALTNDLDDLAAAAHEFEGVLHALRTGKTAQKPDAVASDEIPQEIWSSLKQDEKHTLKQSLAEGARLFLVQTSFDAAGFERQFQELKETLTKTGEVISTSPRMDNEHRGKINFRILYAAVEKPLPVSDISIEEIPLQLSPAFTSKLKTDISALEQSFEKLSAQMANLQIAPVENPFERALRAGRAAARATNKEVDFEVRGEEVFDDTTLAAAVANPLVHLVRNAVDHGIEPQQERARLGKPVRGKIVIEATRLEEQTRITVTDDGRGIDPALIETGLLFRPGFSTATEVSKLSGRGVGLDAVQTTVQQLNGSISVTSSLGEGSTFEITVPLNP